MAWFAVSACQLRQQLLVDAAEAAVAHNQNVVACLGGGGVDWDVAQALAPLGAKLYAENDFERLVETIARNAQSGDHILIMSNGGFNGIHGKLLAQLAGQAA